MVFELYKPFLIYTLLSFLLLFTGLLVRFYYGYVDAPWSFRVFECDLDVQTAVFGKIHCSGAADAGDRRDALECYHLIVCPQQCSDAVDPVPYLYLAPFHVCSFSAVA